MTLSSVPLIELGPNQEGMVVELEGGGGLISRLATLGFTPGATLTMVQNFGRGPVIVRVRDARIALGRGQASSILVRRRKDCGRSDD